MRAECVRCKILDKMSKMVKERCFILLRPTILANFVIFLQFFFYGSWKTIMYFKDDNNKMVLGFKLSHNSLLI